ncbi:MAG: hypothetical protein M9901_03765 [Lentimicrobium sp.]|nr:hypothetical protein [Lentimicrobium sp.]
MLVIFLLRYFQIFLYPLLSEQFHCKQHRRNACIYLFFFRSGTQHPEPLIAHSSHKSLTTLITRERITALNHKSKKKITLEIIDLKDDEGQAKGTLVRFGMPLG